MEKLYTLLSYPFAMKKQALDSLAPLAVKLMKGDTNAYTENKEIRADLKARTDMQIGFNDGGVIAFRNNAQMSDAPAGSIALIRVSGFISQEGNWCMKGLNDYQKEMEAAGTNRNIKGVILQVNSSGGSIAGVDNFSNFVAKFEGKYKKPICAIVENMADSAGYYIIAQAPRIFVNGESAEIGSIGTMVTLYDYSGMMQEEGVKEIIVNASMSENKNKYYYDALKGDVTGMVEYLDKYNNLFTRTVQRGRNGKLNTNITTEIEAKNGQPARTVPEVLTGKVYVGREVIAMGLADEISDLDGAVRYIEQRAMDMGIVDEPTTVVEVESDYTEDEEDYYGYNQTNHTIMFKNLSQETLQASFESGKTQLDAIAKEKGITSAEYRSKAGEVDALEREIELRQYKNSSIELADKLKKADAELTANQTAIAELTAKLETANAENAKNANADAEKLTAENAALLQEKESVLEQLKGIEAEKSQVLEQVAKLTLEQKEATEKVQAYEAFFQKEGLQPPVIKAATFADENGNQPTAEKEDDGIELTENDKMKFLQNSVMQGIMAQKAKK